MLQRSYRVIDVLWMTSLTWMAMPVGSAAQEPGTVAERDARGTGPHLRVRGDRRRNAVRPLRTRRLQYRARMATHRGSSRLGKALRLDDGIRRFHRLRRTRWLHRGFPVGLPPAGMVWEPRVRQPRWGRPRWGPEHAPRQPGRTERAGRDERPGDRAETDSTSTRVESICGVTQWGARAPITSPPDTLTSGLG